MFNFKHYYHYGIEYIYFPFNDNHKKEGIV
jgi:hypothetical protein